MNHLVSRFFLGVVLSFVGLPLQNASAIHTPLVSRVEEKVRSGRVDRDFILELGQEVGSYTDSEGWVTEELQETLSEIETRFSVYFDSGARAEFQTLLGKIGAKKVGPIEMPEEQTPFWLLESDEFVNFRSTPELPTRADYVVIGAGLTGVTAAYYLNKAVGAGKKVVLLEADRPAAQSSGRNGGNFQLLAESYNGSYEGLLEERVKGIRYFRPGMSTVKLMREAEMQAEILFRFNFNNLQRVKQIVAEEKLDCDFRNSGWLRVATTKDEEKAIFKDIAWMRRFRVKQEVWSPEEIKSRLGIPAEFSGRYIPDSGNYHPYKFVTELLRRLLDRGLQFYSGVTVKSVNPVGDRQVILELENGVRIEAGQVIVATNAFTPKLFPELKMIETVPSQIYNLENVQQGVHSSTVTKQNGDIYYNFPASRQRTYADGRRHGMVHFGLDFDHSVPDPSRLERSPELFAKMQKLTDAEFPSTRGQPPSRMWVGPMAFTPDHVPLIGFMYSASSPRGELKDIVIAAGFQGYGGSFFAEAGYSAAQMALTGETLDSVPKDVFGPGRYFSAPVQQKEIKSRL